MPLVPNIVCAGCGVEEIPNDRNLFNVLSKMPRTWRRIEAADHLKAGPDRTHYFVCSDTCEKIGWQKKLFKNREMMN